MIQSSKIMKWLRFLHVTLGGIWLGATVAVLAVALYSFDCKAVEEFLLTCAIIPFLYSCFILPCGLLLIAEGLIYGFVTKWGFVKQKWVMLKWILLICTGLCVGLGGLNQLFALLATAEATNQMPLLGDASFFFFFLGLQLFFLVLMIWLSVWKPFTQKKPAA